MVPSGWNADWVYNGMKILDVQQRQAIHCDEWIDHPVLIVQRDTFANFFHDSEDFFNVFVAMAVLRWKSEDTQIFLTDLFPDGPFWYAQDHPLFKCRVTTCTDH